MPGWKKRPLEWMKETPPLVQTSHRIQTEQREPYFCCLGTPHLQEQRFLNKLQSKKRLKKGYVNRLTTVPQSTAKDPSKGSHQRLQLGATILVRCLSGSDERMHELYHFTDLYVVGNGQTYHPLYFVNIKVNDMILTMEVDTGVAMSDLWGWEGG